MMRTTSLLANEPLDVTYATDALSQVPLSVTTLVTVKIKMFVGALSLTIVNVVFTDPVAWSHWAMSAAMPLPLPSVSLMRIDVIEASVTLSNFTLPEPGSELVVSVE